MKTILFLAIGSCIKLLFLRHSMVNSYRHGAASPTHGNRTDNEYGRYLIRASSTEPGYLQTVKPCKKAKEIPKQGCSMMKQGKTA